MDLMAAFPREPRFNNFIFDYPSLMLAIIGGYLLITLKIGPDFMRDRKPFNPRSITRLYNLFQVICNVWYSVYALELCWRHLGTGKGIHPCGPPTTEMPEIPAAGDTANVIFFSTFNFYVRMFDFMDTVFFVLAKKTSHISFLHVYHHVMVVTTVYVFLRSGWGNTIFHISVLNSIVHVIMYSYYFLATFSSLKPYLWWKRYLTSMQICQFIIMGIHMLYSLSSHCHTPVFLIRYNLIQILVMILLFSRFYTKSYTTTKSSKQQNESKSVTHKLNVD